MSYHAHTTAQNRRGIVLKQNKSVGASSFSPYRWQLSWSLSGKAKSGALMVIGRMEDAAINGMEPSQGNKPKMITKLG
jgi:hypothetical protein